jgi:PAS domain S-box-containing protein
VEPLAQRNARLEAANRALREEVEARRQVERELRERERRFRLLAERASDVIYRYRFGDERGFDYVSPSAYELTGYTLEEHYDDPDLPLRVVHPDDRVGFLEYVENLKSHARATAEFRWTRKDGSLIWTEHRSVPVCDEEGQVVAIEGVVRDISDRKRSDDQLERLRNQFQETQKLRAVGQLASGIAHHFNNLLMGVIGCADLAIHSLDPREAARAYVEAIRAAADRGVSLVNQLLEFSRRRDGPAGSVPIDDEVRATEEVLRGLMGRNIDLRLDLDSDRACVSCDRDQLHQILVNLALNARDAMSGRGRLTIQTRSKVLDPRSGQPMASLSPRTYVVLTVADTGCGMDDETRSRVFEPFFSTKEEGTGTGLGLSSVYGIVSRNGGHIQVDSHPGEGTRVEIFLPRRPDPRADRRRISGRGAKTVLLVDDERALRITARNYLEPHGYRVIEASTSVETLALVREHCDEIDLIVIDARLPFFGFTNPAEPLYELCPDLLVLLTSSDPLQTMAELGSNGSSTEAVRVLRKPFTEGALLDAVRRALDAAPQVASHAL